MGKEPLMTAPLGLQLPTVPPDSSREMGRLLSLCGLMYVKVPVSCTLKALMVLTQLFTACFSCFHCSAWPGLFQGMPVHESLLQLVVALQVSSFKSALLASGANCRCTL